MRSCSDTDIDPKEQWSAQVYNPQRVDQIINSLVSAPCGYYLFITQKKEEKRPQYLLHEFELRTPQSDPKKFPKQRQ